MKLQNQRYNQSKTSKVNFANCPFWTGDKFSQAANQIISIISKILSNLRNFKALQNRTQNMGNISFFDQVPNYVINASV